MIPMDEERYRFPSRRSLVYGTKGLVASSHPQASQVGMEVMKKGGNAVDGALAMAGALTVLEPTGNGLGSDLFAIVLKEGKLYGINGSGPSPKALSRDILANRGLSSMPKKGWIPVCVPGAVGAWGALSRRFGNLSLSEVLAPASELAERGTAVPVSVAKAWKKAAESYGPSSKETAHWFETFSIDGRSPFPGEKMTLKSHAKTLERIGETLGEDFYKGETAFKIADFSRATGGLLTLSDLEEYEPQWEDPIKVNYKGYDVWELPPNCQGLVALMSLGILNSVEIREWDDPLTVHRRIEAIKLAFQNGLKYIGDPDFSSIPLEELLSERYFSEKRNLIKDRDVLSSPLENSGGTVYLASADSEGVMVSLIQSNYRGFGSGVVIPGTGIALNNRGLGFSLEKGHPNEIGPSKRPYNTIIPGFLTKDSKPLGPFGVMGAFMQPQGHLQFLTSMIDHGMNPQEALDAPRWQWTGGKGVSLEQEFPNSLALGLMKLGHKVQVSLDTGSFGRGQGIFKTDFGTLMGATEKRCDGCALGW